VKNYTNKSIKFLTGSKIYLRPFELKDITNEYRIHINQIEFLSLAIKFPSNKIELEEYAKEHRLSKNSIFFSICNLKNDDLIGTASLSKINWLDKNANYGRLIFRNYQNKGYGTEVLNLLKNYAFNYLNLNTILTIVYSDNIGSITSNLKSGARKAGILKKYFFKNNKFVDGIIFQINK